MPYSSIKDIPKGLKGAGLSLAQANVWAKINDSAEKSGADEPAAVAWAQFKKLYKKVGDRWVERATKLMKISTPLDELSIWPKDWEIPEEIATIRLSDNQEIEIPYIIKNRIILKEGVANGLFYPGEELELCVAVLNEKPDPEDVEARKRTSLFWDHDDACKNWLGEIKNFHWDTEQLAIVADIYLVDKVAAEKTHYQLEISDDGLSRWGISPRVKITEKDGRATNIQFVSQALVLDPAGGPKLMLEKDKDKDSEEELYEDLSLEEDTETMEFEQIDTEMEKLAEEFGLTENEIAKFGEEQLELLKNVPRNGDSLAEKFECQCIECGYEMTSEKHCKDLCLSGTTKILLLDGRSLTIPQIIEELKQDKNLWVYSARKDGSFLPQKIIKAQTTKFDKMLEITLDNDKSFECTYDHPIMMRNGVYKRADSLRVKDSVMPFNTMVSEKTGKYKLGGYRFFWDLVEDKWRPVHLWVVRELGLHHLWSGITHHKNFDKLDNNPDNLPEMTHKKHRGIHVEHLKELRKNKTWVKKLYESLHSPEAKAKRIKSQKKWWKGKEGQKYIKEVLIIRARKMWEDDDYKLKMSKAATVHIKKLNANPTENLIKSRLNFTKAGHEWARNNRGKMSVWAKKSINKIVEKKCPICDKWFEGKNASFAAHVGHCRRKVGLSPKIKRDTDRRGRFLKKGKPVLVNHKIKNIEKIEAKQGYDITINGFPNFAISAGIFVHNSCPKCGAQMRRAERPGPGQPSPEEQIKDKEQSSIRKYIENFSPILKIDGDEHIVKMVVLEPEVADNHGHVVSEAEIQNAMYLWMEQYKNTEVMHRDRAGNLFPMEEKILSPDDDIWKYGWNNEFAILECYQSPIDYFEGEEIVRKGSWVLTLRVNDENIWQKIKSKELTGASIGGHAALRAEVV